MNSMHGGSSGTSYVIFSISTSSGFYKLDVRKIRSMLQKSS